MELTGQQIINAPRQTVYDALNDPDILKQCIPGCEELNKTSDTQMDAVVAMKVGPVKAKFKGAVELTDLNPPESYTIVGEGKGGAAGFAKGRAEVKLTDQGNETLLDYAVKADVGGKLAQLGARLIDSTAKKLSGEFFEKFGEVVGGETEDAAIGETDAESAVPGEQDADGVSEAEAKKGINAWWVALVALVLGLVYFLFLSGTD